jgi:ribosomal protein S7
MKDGKKVASEKIIKNILIKISLKGYSPVNVITLAIKTLIKSSSGKKNSKIY